VIEHPEGEGKPCSADARREKGKRTTLEVKAEGGKFAQKNSVKNAQERRIAVGWRGSKEKRNVF